VGSVPPQAETITANRTKRPMTVICLVLLRLKLQRSPKARLIIIAALANSPLMASTCSCLTVTHLPSSKVIW